MSLESIIKDISNEGLPAAGLHACISMMTEKARPNLAFYDLTNIHGSLYNFPMAGASTAERQWKLLSRYLKGRKPSQLVKQMKSYAGGIFHRMLPRLPIDNASIPKEKRNQLRCGQLYYDTTFRQRLIMLHLGESCITQHFRDALPIIEFEMMQAWRPEFAPVDIRTLRTPDNIMRYLSERGQVDPISRLRFISHGEEARTPIIRDRILTHMGNPIFKKLRETNPEMASQILTTMGFLAEKVHIYVEQMLVDLKHWSDYSDEQKTLLANALLAGATLIGNPEVLTLAFSVESGLLPLFQSVELSAEDDYYPINWQAVETDEVHRKPLPQIIQLLQTTRHFAEAQYQDTSYLETMRDLLDEAETATNQNQFQVLYMALGLSHGIRNALGVEPNDTQHVELHNALCVVMDAPTLETKLASLRKPILIWECYIETAIEEQSFSTAIIELVECYKECLSEVYAKVIDDVDHILKQHQQFMIVLSEDLPDVPIASKIGRQQAAVTQLELAIDSLFESITPILSAELPNEALLDASASMEIDADVFGLTSDHPAILEISHLKQMLHQAEQSKHALAENADRVQPLEQALEEARRMRFECEQRLEAMQTSFSGSSVEAEYVMPFELLEEFLPSLVRSASAHEAMTFLTQLLPSRLACLESAFESFVEHQNMLNTSELVRRVLLLATKGLDRLRQGEPLYAINDIIPGCLAIHESDTVMNSEQLRKHRIFKDQAGMPVEITSHLPIDGHTRLYFDYDDEADVIRVAYAGKHLPYGAATTV